MEIAIISGKGGTGKSSVSAAFMSMTPDVKAIDCDVDAANLYLIFHPTKEEERVYISGKHAVVDPDRCTGCGLCESLCRFEAIQVMDECAVVNEVGCEGCSLCYRTCPQQAISMEVDDQSRIYSGSFRYGKMIYGRLAPGEENSGKMVNALRTYSKQASTKDDKSDSVTLLDGPPGIGCPVLSTITGVDKVVIVTEPTISGFSDLQRAVEVVRHFEIPTYIIVNKSTLNPDVTYQITTWCSKEQLPVVATLPFDRDVVDAMVAGQTIVEYRPQSLTTHLLQEAYRQILGN